MIKKLIDESNLRDYYANHSLNSTAEFFNVLPILNSIKNTKPLKLINVNYKNFLFDFLAKNENAVLDAVKKCLPGVKVTIEYVRTYADETVVKNKILEFFNRYNQMIFKRMKDENVKISIGDDDIEINLTFETGAYTLLTANDTVEKLTDYLDNKFNYNIIFYLYKFVNFC